MGDTTVGDDRESLTLAFSLAALDRFADPAAVFDDAREWSRHIGIIANDTDAVETFIREHDLWVDFDPGDRDKWLALAEIREATATGRHVFVGRTDDDRRAATNTGWEFVSVSEAARKAEWTLEDDSTRTRGFLGRGLDRFP